MEDDDDIPQPPSKAAKLLAVLLFFMVLFFIAASVGLPVPVGLVLVFFITAAAPTAFIVALGAALLFRLIARASGRHEAWPFFDVALQTFIVGALLATGVFIVNFPGWVRASYPGIRADVEETLDKDVAAGEKSAFLESLDRFWEWNVRFLLEEGEAPSTVAQEEMRATVSQFGESLAPDCPECDPALSRAEIVKLTAAMNGVTLGHRAVTAPTAPAPVTAPAEAASPAITAPSGVTAHAESVTSASPR